MFWCLYICWTYIYIHQLSWHGNEFLPTGYCTSFSWKLVNTLICTFRGNVSCHLIFNHLQHIGHLNVLAHLLEAGVGKLSQRHFLLYFRKCPNIVTAIINLHKSGKESAAKISPYQHASLTAVLSIVMFDVRGCGLKRLKMHFSFQLDFIIGFSFYQPIIPSQHSGEYDSICSVCVVLWLAVTGLLRLNYGFHLKWSRCGTQSNVGHIYGQWTVYRDKDR